MNATFRSMVTTIAIALMAAASCNASQADSKPTVKQQCVILLHGLGRSALSMKALQWHLQQQGYHVSNTTYPSLTMPIEELAPLAIEQGVQDCQQYEPTEIHFVTHSLGGILLRQYLAHKPIAAMGRVIMLGPPNQGSQLADAIGENNLLNSLQPPAARQLRTTALARKLGSVDFELGVIAGDANYRPFVSAALDGSSDGTVLVSETRVDGMKDFIVLPVTHTLMMWQQSVIVQVDYFLANGKFLKQDLES